MCRLLVGVDMASVTQCFCPFSRVFLVLNLIVVEPLMELYVRLLQEGTGVETTEGAPGIAHAG